MSLTPDDIENQVFKERFRGYDPEEVDAFLDRVSEQLVEIQRERDAALERAHAAEQRATTGAGEQEQLLSRTLLTAERTAEQTVAEARSEAEQLREDARTEAEQLREEARSDAAALRRQAEEDAREERETARAAAERIRQAVAELRAFRDDYRDRVEAVISEQLSALDRVELPEIPPAVDQLAEVEVDNVGPRGGDG